jgi:hypothetical protein
MASTKVNPIKQLNASGTADGTTFLRGDATWATVLSGTFPFYLQDGSSSPINLTSDSKVPFILDDGVTASDISLTI